MQNSINDQLTALVDDTNASLARLEGIKAGAIGKITVSPMPMVDILSIAREVFRII